MQYTPSQYEFAAVARLHYKAGDKKQAFLDYVDLYNNRFKGGRIFRGDQDTPDIPDFLDGKHFVLTLHEGDKPIGYQYYQETSCFDYLGFLAFMNAEYEKLGEPAEYEAAMTYYRALENEATFEAFLPMLSIDEEDPRFFRVP
ncbi:MAG: hypothetical protein ACOX0A_10125 [Thermoguttaceae bacterium]